MTQPLTMKYGTTITPESERVPIEPITEILRREIKKYRALYEQGNEGAASGSRYVAGSREGMLEIMSFHTGLNIRLLRRIIRGFYETGDKRNGTYQRVDWVPFDVADKIVCGTVGPFAWQTEPLNQFYGPLSVRRHERGYELPEEVAA